MGSGRPSWTRKLSTHELQAVHDWIDSDADYKAADVYRMLNLVRYARPATFRHYVRQRRERRGRGELEEGSLPPSSFSVDSLEEVTRGAIGKTLLTGEMPAYALPAVLASIARLERAKVAQEAGQRAMELHEAKMREMDKSLEEVAQAKRLSAEQVAEIREKVLGL